MQLRRKMNYLYFDIECCDGNHICSFGYVITDENFNILEKKDIVINPQWRFKLGRDGFDPRINLAYTESTFQKQKTFKYYYEDIKDLLTRSNQILLGHSITADIQYLKIACERYGCDNIDLEIYDTQDFYYQLNKKYKTRSLDNIVNDLGIDISNLQEHKSCDDAEISMLVAKEICDKLSITLSDLLELCDKSKRNGDKRELGEKALKRKFSRDLKNIAEKYPNRFSRKAICISDTIKETDYELRIALIKEIFKNGYNYICKASECDYFVHNNEYGERDLSCDHNIEDNHKDIKKITIEELSKMLKIEINENGEYIKHDENNCKDTAINAALIESLKKKGISYEDWLKQFEN